MDNDLRKTSIESLTQAYKSAKTHFDVNNTIAVFPPLGAAIVYAIFELTDEVRQVREILEQLSKPQFVIKSEK